MNEDDLERFMRFGPILFARFSDSNTQTATNSAFNAVGSNGKVYTYPICVKDIRALHARNFLFLKRNLQLKPTNCLTFSIKQVLIPVKGPGGANGLLAGN